MLSQYDLPLSDASISAPTRSGILTPASDYSLNLSDGVSSGAKKRKRDGNTMEDLLKESFVVKPYPKTVSVKSRSLQPLLLLPRSSLPLAHLDFTPSSNALPQSRLFEAHVKILELEERMGSQPTVLIARLDDGRTLYAAEREDRGLYVICRLGSWVNLQQLKDAAVALKQDFPKGSEKTFGPNLTQFQGPTRTSIPPEPKKYDKKKRLAIEAIQSMIKRQPNRFSSEFQPISQRSEPTAELQPAESQPEVPVINPPPIIDPMLNPTGPEIFDSVRTQYLEALHLSKASLAYFAKGPLSRARAAFHLDYDSTLDMNDHVSFLESLILSTTMIDKKYREGVPTCVSMIDIQDHSANEANEASSKTKKRKSSKKMKPGKNGLYPTEETLIQKWWLSHDDDAESGDPGNTKEEVAKNRIANLRIRETQLQLIIILEVLALRPLVSQSDNIGDGLPLALPMSELSQPKERQAKPKKHDPLAMLIDVHMDRLCIWQSIQLENVKSLVDTQNIFGDLGSLAQQPTHADNMLRDFCIEVIAPFFSARLPDRCAIINRKLGGPVASPPKPRLSKSTSFSASSAKPGAATKRPVPAKPQRSLQRVLTDERERRSQSRGPERSALLRRSMTMPSAPVLKREASEAALLSGIPMADSVIVKSKQLARREVDLGNLVQNANNKASKQAAIDAELKDAISLLKRPNREQAGKSLAETAERRTVSATHSRKSKKPVRNPLFAGVQISATPKTNRMKDMLAKSEYQMLSVEKEILGFGPIPSSSVPRIPQSVSQSALHARNPLFSTIQVTPTRASSQGAKPLDISKIDQPNFPPSSPLQVRRSSAQLFSAKRVVPDSVNKPPTTSWISQGIQETPVKKKQDINIPHGHPIPTTPGFNKENDQVLEKKSEGYGISQNIEARQEESIYKSLGWDDVDDFDELA